MSRDTLCARDARRQGRGPKELLGHARLHVTADIYAHVRPRLHRNAIEAMNRALHPDDTDPDDDTPPTDD
ncbi:hypothetical protein Vqi01_33040 [Micromonospora qiuiae]|uniref:Integrase n=1 Tax=Micromonospora qiuiae TaxID=502268 RepID=A0ABQ4JDG9_9ACTN|nr:hypothetical protein Vqi01_33040 [Micromonospora qiuiae]